MSDDSTDDEGDEDSEKDGNDHDRQCDDRV